jgi:hypothetical protein
LPITGSSGSRGGGKSSLPVSHLGPPAVTLRRKSADHKSRLPIHLRTCIVLQRQPSIRASRPTCGAVCQNSQSTRESREQSQRSPVDLARRRLKAGACLMSENSSADMVGGVVMQVDTSVEIFVKYGREIVVAIVHLGQ